MMVFWYFLPLLATFISAGDVCSNDICHNHGECHMINGTNTTTIYNCQCQKCFTGKHCEFKNNIIPLSLTSSMLTDIRNSRSAQKKNTKRIVFVLVISIFVLISLISNFLSLQTFLSRDKNYGQRANILGNNRIFLTLYCVYVIILVLKLQSRVILMLFDQYSSASYKFYSCNIAPVFSTMLIHLGLWLSASITVERTLFHLFLIEVMDTYAKRRTLIISISMAIIVCLTHLHETAGQQALPDPAEPNSFICSFDYEKKWLNTLDGWLSTLHLAIPCFIHLVCVVLELWRIDRLKYLPKNRDISRRTLWFDELKHQRSHLIPPLLIIVCCLPHFIFAHLMYHCIESSQYMFLHLHIALNLFVFLPQAITFFIYVLPSDYYMEEFRSTTIGRLINFKFCIERQQSLRNRSDTEMQLVF